MTVRLMNDLMIKIEQILWTEYYALTMTKDAGQRSIEDDRKQTGRLCFNHGFNLPATLNPYFRWIN